MFILKILSYFFLAVVKIRIFLYKYGILKSYKIDNIKIVSIGNISLGGTGKTPVTLKIAENLLNKGFSVAILLRGYKKKSKEQLIVVHNGEKISSDVFKSGDEAIIYAKNLNCPVVVCSDRVYGAKFIKENFNTDFILLDDGFQHLKLKRDKDIVLITENSLLKDKIYLLPAGKFREPLSHLKRADTIILTKSFSNNRTNIIKKLKKFKKPIYLSSINIKYFFNLKTGEKVSSEFLKGNEYILVSGIGEPSSFEAIIKNEGIIISKHLIFPDHYYYKEKDYKKFNKYKNPIITTEKDAVKLDTNKISSEIYILVIEYSFHKT